MNFGFLYNSEKEHEKAIELYKKGLSLEYDEQRKGYFNYNIANALYKLGRYWESNNYNNRALLIIKSKLVREDILELKEALLDEL